ncbi:MAG: CHAT domain-containing protein, partial [Cyanobacteria bacterium P01_D01_bin.50]
FLLALFTTFLCIYLSYFFDSSNYLTVALVKSQILPSSVSSRILAVNSTKSSSFLKESQELYQEGQYDKAVQILNQAITEFKKNNDKLNEAIARSNLSLAYQRLGKWQEAQEAVTQSIEILRTLENSAQVAARALDVRGGLELARGQTEAALGTWQEAAKIYQQLDDTFALIQNRINQAQAMQSLGNYLQARDTLDSLTEILEKQPNSSLQAKGWLSLGNVLQVLGDFSKSEEILNKSLEFARSVKDVNIESNALLSLGNIALAQRYTQLSLGNSKGVEKYTKAAIEYYQQAAKTASIIPNLRLQAQLNQLRLLVEVEEKEEKEQKFTKAKALLPEIKSQIDNLPPSRTAVNIRINFAQSLSKMIKSDIKVENVARMLAQAVQMAQNLKDERSESYALGSLGELYEQIGQLSEAQILAQQALVKAESIDARDIAYQWHWLRGKILQQQSNIPEATAAYNRAYKALNSLSQDFAGINSDVQFSFRESVEPVYRKYVDLLLKPGENTDRKLETLVEARQVIESLQLAELNDFFRSPCVLPKVEIDELVDNQKSTAVIYPIILEDRLEIITKLAGENQLYRTTQPISRDKLENNLEQLQEYLPDATQEFQVRQKSQELYEWLIEDIEPTLVNKGIKSLVFVLDGYLRNIPMAVLYDKQEQKYLIEKYAIALTPSLQLVEPKPLKTVQLNALVAGIEEEQTIEGKSYPQLPNVQQELEQVKSEIKTSEKLLNQELTRDNLENEIQSNPFSVVHIATHGQFSSDPEETYITIWRDKLKIEELDSLLRVRDTNRSTAIELLVLSACQTASGDSRAALGLAGVAVRAGARSTIATLWPVDDESTRNFMGELYRHLDDRSTKAEALQRAQIAILKQENRPYFWAPYVLIGNWL